MASGNTGHVPRQVINWVTFTMALVSFAISIYTFYVTTRAPVVEVILPQQIRIAQGEKFGYAYAYFQPTLVSTGRSQQIEVIRDLTLEFAPTGGAAEPVQFTWRESGRIVYNPATQQTAYAYESDATPLLLSREAAQSPLATFYGPPGWFFVPGKWRGTLTVTQVANRQQIREAFELALTDSDVATLNAGGGDVYVSVAVIAAP